MPKNKSWYKIEASAADEATIYVYDEISAWGISAKQFVEDLKGVATSTLNLRVNSPGGNVFDGVTIYNALKQHAAKVVVHIDGLAASIASIIAMAGDEIRMADNAMMMIHKAWTWAADNADGLRDTAAILDKIDGTLVTTYAAKTGQSEKAILKMMKAETWMNAQDALDNGFIDTITGATEAKASFDLSRFEKAPEQALMRFAARAEPTERDLETVLRDAGVSRNKAKIAVAAIKSDSQRDADGLEDAARALLATFSNAKTTELLLTN